MKDGCIIQLGVVESLYENLKCKEGCTWMLSSQRCVSCKSTCLLYVVALELELCKPQFSGDSFLLDSASEGHEGRTWREDGRRKGVLFLGTSYRLLECLGFFFPLAAAVSYQQSLIQL